MLADKKIQYVLDSLMNDLQFEADVTDLDAKIIASTSKLQFGRSDANIPKPGGGSYPNIFIKEGRTYSPIHIENKVKYYISLVGSGKSTKDFATLIAKLIEANLTLINRKLSREECLRKILSGDISGFDIEEAIADHKIDADLPRSVIVIRTPKLKIDKVYEILSEAFSKNRMDILVHMDERTIALVKTLTDETENGDFEQLAAAIFETVFSETSIKVIVGVGSCKSALTWLRDSYIDAQKAIEVGLIYNPSDNIYINEDLLLERFVNQIPDNIAESFVKHIFTVEFDKMFNAEMMATVKNLFDNSLNLSEAARRLYIHRNTLVYRIDKIENAIGLDLRNFHDAVTFRIMMMLKMRK